MLYPLSHEQRKQIAAKHAQYCIDKVSCYKNKLRPLAPISSDSNYKIKIGYVSSDFGNHPTAHLMQSIPGKHDLSKFEIYCYSLSPDDGTQYRKKIERESQHFVDLSSIGDNLEAADRIRSDGIDILLNMNGYTKGARNEIFALQPAPVQAMWLGYPGSSGADFMDYIITDDQTSPIELKHVYSEKLVHMKRTFFIGDHAHMFKHMEQKIIVGESTCNAVINFRGLPKLVEALGADKVEKEFETGVEGDRLTLTSIPRNSSSGKNLSEMVRSGKQSLTVDGIQIINGLMLSQFELQASQGEAQVQGAVYTSRDQYGLPDDAVIYCNFNQLYKLDPVTMNSWCKILKAVPNSVIWLLRFPALGEKHVHDWIKKYHGLPKNRVIFSSVAPKEEHVRRGQIADVCLDTPLCNGHTTGMDVLWAGAPMVTLPLETFASRVASSQLKTLGLNELIATDYSDYEKIAIKLGNDATYRKNIRSRLWKARLTNNLFSTADYASKMEEIYKRMYERYRAGQKPDHLI